MPDFSFDVISILVAILIFSFLVLIHELGHFLAAKREKVKVLEFGFGFPPRLFGKKFGETIYSINLIPFGGFVKLYGEDSEDKDALKSPRSFQNKSKWARIKIICAGVFMNFLAAFLALLIGFSFGIEPLIVDYNDFMSNVKSGVVEVESGFRLKEIKKATLVEEAKITLQDEIIAIDEMPIFELELSEKKDATTYSKVTFVRSGKTYTYLSPNKFSYDNLGLLFKNIAQIPRLAVYKDAGPFLRGDMISRVNGEIVMFYEDLLKADMLSAHDKIIVLRDKNILEFVYPLSLVPLKENFISTDEYPFIIESFVENSVAKKAGFKEGDEFVSLNGEKILNIVDLQKKSALLKGKELVFVVKRDGREQKIQMNATEDGLIGAYLSPIFNYNGSLPFNFAYENVSVSNIKKIKYPFFSALQHTGEEMVRIGFVTAAMFGKVLQKIFFTLEVPDGIAGPVGIAKMTAVYVKEGILSLLRFIALLSLSLAVINILPIPALDGGRLLFILIEAVLGRKINPRVEIIIHSIGFFLLVFLLIFVTVKDFSNIF